MYEKEIRNFKWKISKDLKIVRFDYPSVLEDEQECHFNIIKRGFNKEETPETIVSCSYPKYTTKLKNSELFTLTEILVSKIKKDKELGGFILEVQGIMPINAITIRSKIIKLSDKQRQKRADKMRIIGKKK